MLTHRVKHILLNFIIITLSLLHAAVEFRLLGLTSVFLRLQNIRNINIIEKLGISFLNDHQSA